MADFPLNKGVDTYFYDGQIKNRLTQFAAVFAGLKVSVGKNDFNSTSNLITVPIRYGNADRVVNAILAGNAQKPISLPIMSFYPSSFEMAPDLRKGVNQTIKRSVLPAGSSFPDGVKVIEKVVPIPYRMSVDLDVHASNEEQNFQILEQIMMLFNPDIQLQTSDDAEDWNKIFKVELLSINNQTNYPSNQDSRIIKSSFTFSLEFYLSPPALIKDNYVREIKIRLNTLNSINLDTDDFAREVQSPNTEYIDLFGTDNLEFPK
jgi:hypothetical protein